jgi:predicted SnoaL-like aldol condensation-catalyzing enzyme
MISKPRAADFYRRLYSADHASAAAEFLSPDYIEHQAGTGFSRAGLLDYVRRRLDQYPGHELLIHRTIVQGDFEFLHVEERLDDSQTVARGELFRWSGERIAEHWSAHVLDKKPRKNPHTTFDGPDVDRGKDSAAKYLRRFDELDRRGFGEFEFEAFRESRTPRYIQHSPTGRDTVQGLVDVLIKLEEIGTRLSLEVKRNLTEGDFILTHRLYRTHPPFPEFKTINVFDLFRIDDEGRADEHWDIMEEIAAESDIARMF